MINPIKILYIIGSLDIGGAEKHLLRTLPELNKRGYAITIWTLTHKGKLSPDFEKSGIRVISAFGNADIPQVPKFVRSLRMAISAIKLFMFLRVNKPDIVHFFLPAAYLVGGIVSILARQKIMIMSRRSLNNYQQRQPLYSTIEKHLHKFMSAVLCNSRKIEDQLVGENIPPEKIGIIYNGIDVCEKITKNEKLQIRKNYGINESTLVLVMVANYIGYKGHSDLIKAMGQIKNSIKNDWILICIGRDDGIKNSLEEMAESEGISPNTRLLDADTDVVEILSIADIGLLCSHEEGFSNSILEAMAHGLPVIATDVGGNSEAVVNDVTGLIVPARNPVLLGNAILKLVNDEVLRQEMGKRGKSRVMEIFTQEKCIDLYDRLYLGLIEAKETNIKNLINQPIIN